MNECEVRGLDAFLEKIDDAIAKAPEKRRQFHAACAVRLKEEVDMQIQLSVNDAEGHVRGWQTESVGTGGGYAAVRPKKGEVGADSPGAITNYLENGHRIRGSENKTRAFLFYSAARSRAKAILLEEAENFVDTIWEGD